MSEDSDPRLRSTDVFLDTMKGELEVREKGLLRYILNLQDYSLWNIIN